MNNIATIVTHDHIDQALTLLSSMQQYKPTTMHLLLIKPNHQKLPTLLKYLENSGQLVSIKLYTVDQLTQDQNVGIISRFIVSKYSRLSLDTIPEHIDINDYMRWSLKPQFLQMLLNTGIDNILYCDCDLYFYNDFSFITDLFNDNRIVLSPHWRVIRPVVDNDYKYNFIHGLYNAGFIGVRNDSTDMLEWWGEMCAHECSTEATLHGTYVDQKYLDIVPLYFEGVYTLKHKGCNVAGWNLKHLERSITNNQITIEGDPILFIHFSLVTIKQIENGLDPLLSDAYDTYCKSLKNQRLNLVRQQMPECISQRQSEEDKKAIV